MSKLYNTPFEASLRILLILETSRNQSFSADMLAAIDFISIYGKEFGISDENLHGENNYKFSEFTLRRELIKKAIKQLVLDDLIKVHPTKNGFTYSINQKGLNYSEYLSSDYATAYRRAVSLVREFTSDKTEREVLEFINRRSIYSLRED
ncbi:hypothetical protein PB1_04200 [Bacillus methanolicus PB1]|uniref:Uncharacterized protein n=1 Tax=Bacillus methanolicus PB1 TaxID=997296 RepID=I3E6I7_BACMT|nr:ABC-three component system middle component 2 [Bacillus methanolicus]EIJ82108.1 hypothetical protein PB1_04200 [Bacillus methanolicus PB1]